MRGWSARAARSRDRIAGTGPKMCEANDVYYVNRRDVECHLPMIKSLRHLEKLSHEIMETTNLIRIGEDSTPTSKPSLSSF